MDPRQHEPARLYLHLDVIYRGPKGNYTVVAGAAEHTPLEASFFGWRTIGYAIRDPLVGAEFEAAFHTDYDAVSLTDPLANGSAFCDENDCLASAAEAIRSLEYRYSLFGPNSNTFARSLLRRCGVPERLPSGWNDADFPGWAYEPLL